jgi:REP element-mobilizing transposase RayT
MAKESLTKGDPALDRVFYQLRASGLKHDPPNRMRAGIHTRGYLPHVKLEGASYFVTFRLADSLPREVLLRFERERDEHLRRLASAAPGPSSSQDEISREFRRKVERYLDRGIGKCHLRCPDVAGLVADALRYFDNDRYVLDDWTVMPNHVHVIVWPMPNQLLHEILKSWKRFTAREANKVLGRTGHRFWQPESYDHWIRGDREKERIRRYIRNNPVKAGLCQSPEAWRWGSAWPGWKQEG